MKLFIRISNKKNLPAIGDLVKYMWNIGISFSKAGDSTKLETLTYLSLCWDKWLDDSRFENHPKFKEYIYIERFMDIGKKNTIFSFEIDDDALFVDIRAFFRGAIKLAQRSEGELSLDQLSWMNLRQFLEIYTNYIEVDFMEAVEKSLSNY